MAAPLSVKHLAIDQANKRIFIVVTIASFIAVFSLVSCKALLSQRSYYSKVITEKSTALKILKDNNAKAQELATSYKKFTEEPVNIIGGRSDGKSDKDGDNAKIVLDALPSKYDFPALATSLEKLLSVTQGVRINAITGTDDEIAQSTATNTGQPIEIPFDAGVTGSYASIQGLFGVLQKSTRPIVIKKITLNGNDGNLTATLSAMTFYLPEKSLGITTKEVKWSSKI